MVWGMTMKMERYKTFKQIYSYLDSSQRPKIFLGLLALVFFTFMSIINALIYSFFIQNVMGVRDTKGLLIVVPGFLILYGVESAIL